MLCGSAPTQCAQLLGSEPLVNDIHQAHLWQAHLWQALQGKAPDGGLWNGRKVADWLSEVTGTTISRQRGWEILRQMTFRLRSCPKFVIICQKNP
jgi:hypothetical protein